MEDRPQFVSDFIESLIKTGCSHTEVKQSIAVVADILEAVLKADIHPADFTKNAISKEAIITRLGAEVPWGSIGNFISSLAGGAMNTASNVAGRLSEGVINNALPIAVLGPLAAGVAGYGGGQMLANIGDDPNDRISAIKHQELMAALRQSTRRLKGIQRVPLPTLKRKETPPPEEEKKDKDDGEDTSAPPQ